jgi:hypothetical protein
MWVMRAIDNDYSIVDLQLLPRLLRNLAAATTLPVRRVETIVNPIFILKVLAASLSFTGNLRWRSYTVSPIAPFTNQEPKTNAQEKRSDDEPSRAKATQNSP